MGVDVDTAEGDDGGADEDEDEDDEHGNHDSEDLAAYADLVALPVDVLGRRDFGVLDLQRPALVQILFLHLVNTTTANRLKTSMQPRIKHIVVTVIPETVDFGLLVLEVHKGRDDLGVDAEGVDELGEFLLLALEGGEVLLVARAENELKLFLLDLLLDLVQFLEV